MVKTKQLTASIIIIGFSIMLAGCGTTTTHETLFSDSPRIEDISNKPLKRQPLPDDIDNETTIIIPSDMLFETNTANLKREAYPILDSVVSITQNYPNWNVHVSGNADPIGSNLTFKKASLSLQQAQLVTGYLWKQELPITELTYSGDKEKSPIATNKTLSGMAKNRRIQITIYAPISKRDSQRISDIKKACLEEK